MELDGGITLYKLKVFSAVVQLGSVTKAAERLNVAQPAVTSHIRQLEEKFGMALFQRQGRSLVLTDGGERVYRWAQDLRIRSEELEQEIDRLKKGFAGTVNLVATMAIGSYRLADVTVNFQKRNPHARIVTNITNPVLATEMIRNGTSDFGVVLLDPQQRYDELVIEILWREPLFLVAKRNSRHLKPGLTLDRIKDVPFATPPIGLVTRAMEDELLRTTGVTRRNVVAEFGHPEGMKRMIMADAAICFLMGSTVQAEIERGDLVRINIQEFRGFFLPIYLVYRRNKVLNTLEKSLMTEIRQGISDDILL